MRPLRLVRAFLLAFVGATVVGTGACARRPPADALPDRAGEELEAETRAICAFGPRVTGTRECARAEEWAASRFREAGLEVRLEPWTWMGSPAGAGVPRNIVADIRGRGRAAEIVLLAAHLDTVPGSPGANDDAVNAALVLGAARAMRAQGPASRTVRFALFTGEEENLLGSRAYVGAHASDLPGHVLAIVLDLGSAPVRGFYLNGRKEELRALFQRALSSRRSARDLLGLYTVWAGADSLAFVEAGVPTLAAFQDLEPYRAVYHSPRDIVETVDFTSSRANAALAAALVRGVADDPAAALRRMSPEETAALLSRYGIRTGRPDASVP